MDYQQALESLKNPNDKFNLDLMAIRTVLLDLVSKSNQENIQNGLMEEPVKKGKRKCLA